MRAHATLTCVALVAPVFLSAQSVSGSASGMLSERTSYVAFFVRRQAEVVADVVVLMRGQPHWQSSPAERPGYMMSRNSVGFLSSEPATPVTYRTTIGSREFELSYYANRRILRVDNTDYPLDASNVLVIDRVDGIGGPPIMIRQLRLILPAVEPRSEFPMALSKLRALQEFLRD